MQFRKPWKSVYFPYISSIHITKTESRTYSLENHVFNFQVTEVTVQVWIHFLVLSSQQGDPDDGGLQAHEVGHDEENIKVATDPGRKVGVNLN